LANSNQESALLLRDATSQLRRVSSMDHFRHGLKANDFRDREKFDWSLERLAIIAIAEQTRTTSARLPPNYAMR
jgi:hypothetical protein